MWLFLDIQIVWDRVHIEKRTPFVTVISKDETSTSAVNLYNAVVVVRCVPNVPKKGPTNNTQQQKHEVENKV